MLSIKLLVHSYNFFKNVLSRHSIKMANIKLGDLYLFKKESKDIIELLTKNRNIKNFKNKSSNELYNIFKKQSKNKKRIDDIREELKNLTYNVLKSESKDIKRNLYNIEKQRKISSKKN